MFQKKEQRKKTTAVWLPPNIWENLETSTNSIPGFLEKAIRRYVNSSKTLPKSARQKPAELESRSLFLDADLWKNFKAKAQEEGLTLRQALTGICSETLGLPLPTENPDEKSTLHIQQPKPKSLREYRCTGCQRLFWIKARDPAPIYCPFCRKPVDFTGNRGKLQLS